METKTCNACGCTFTPRHQNPNQRYCANSECQRERRRRWQQQKRRDDADYRDENPTYAERNRNLQQQRNRNLRASVIANEDVSRPFDQLPAGRYRMTRIEDGIANGDAWIVEIAVLAVVPATEDV